MKLRFIELTVWEAQSPRPGSPTGLALDEGLTTDSVVTGSRVRTGHVVRREASLALSHKPLSQGFAKSVSCLARTEL